MASPESLVTVELAGDHIMSQSRLTARAWSQQPFTLRLGRADALLAVRRGVDEGDGRVRSASFEEAQHVEVDLGGWITPRNFDDPTKRIGDGRGYSERFYPFVSSLLQGTIGMEEGVIGTLIVTFTDPHRPGWNERRATGDGREQDRFADAPRADGWSNYFSWSPPVSEVSVDVPLRLAGPALSRMVGFPVTYWVLSLVAIALASELDSAAIGAAAIVALLAFLVQQWSTTDRPHRLSLMAALYLSGASLAVIWGVGWLTVGKWTVALAPFYALLALATVGMASRFTDHGYLPAWVARGWWHVIRLLRPLARSWGLDFYNDTRELMAGPAPGTGP